MHPIVSAVTRSIRGGITVSRKRGTVTESTILPLTTPCHGIGPCGYQICADLSRFKPGQTVHILIPGGMGYSATLED